MQTYPAVTLKPGKERSIHLKHPWIFSGAIQSVEENIREGDLSEVYSSTGKYLGTGHYHEGSIKVRLITFNRCNIDESFWYQAIQDALTVRKKTGLVDCPNTNVYRLIHGEGDNLPGLIADIYSDCAVIQTHSMGMLRSAEEIGAGLREVYGNRLHSIYLKGADTVSDHDSVLNPERFLLGNKTETEVTENNITFYVNFPEGQKTGFFIDQRENRKLLGFFAKGKKVLNTFSYSGGFSMYALQGGASEVHSVDSSARAENWCMKNAVLNHFNDRHGFFRSDAFDYLKKVNETYDIVVLDPPAFAKHLSAVKNALTGYRNLNTEGIKKVRKGGLVFTFSCSQAIDKELFRKVVFQAAAQTNRKVRILYQLSQGPDHPVNIFHPEGEYLKGLVLMAD